MKFFALFLFTFFLSFATYASVPDSSKNIVQKGVEALKLQKARSLMDGGDYNGAMLLYQKYLNEEPNNALYNFRLGECLHYMKKNNDALIYLEKAYRIDSIPHKEFSYIYAKALQKAARFEEAKVQIDTFKNRLKENDKFYKTKAETIIKEIAYAKGMMENPVDVEIGNLGDAINSKYDEYGPAISGDGKTLLYTSRRPDTKGGARDPYDNKFLEDIYMSAWNEELGAWNNAEPVPGRVNTEDHDGCLSLSPDGTMLYVYRNEGDAGFGAGDVYESRKLSSGKFTPAKRLPKPINSSYFESSASVTKDGSKMYFISEREKSGGYGRADIYVSEKLGRKEWSEPKNLGNLINTKGDERMVFIHPEGKVLFFSSNGHESIGGYDVYMSKFDDVEGKWTKPVNLGYPINTVDDEVNFTMTSDNKKAFITGYFEAGFGALDIYEVDLSKYNVLELEPAEDASKAEGVKDDKKMESQ